MSNATPKPPPTFNNALPDDRDCVVAYGGRFVATAFIVAPRCVRIGAIIGPREVSIPLTKDQALRYAAKLILLANRLQE